MQIIAGFKHSHKCVHFVHIGSKPTRGIRFRNHRFYNQWMHYIFTPTST